MGIPRVAQGPLTFLMARLQDVMGDLMAPMGAPRLVSRVLLVTMASARVGGSIFYCNLQLPGILRPWRQGRRIDFLL